MNGRKYNAYIKSLKGEVTFKNSTINITVNIYLAENQTFFKNKSKRRGKSGDKPINPADDEKELTPNILQIVHDFEKSRQMSCKSKKIQNSLEPLFHIGSAHFGSFRYYAKYPGSSQWEKALIRANIIDFRWHDLRHTWASWHVQNGTPLHVLKELGGWSDLTMVLRYAHLSSKHLEEYAGNSKSCEKFTTRNKNDPEEVT